MVLKLFGELLEGGKVLGLLNELLQGGRASKLRVSVF